MNQRQLSILIGIAFVVAAAFTPRVWAESEDRQGVADTDRRYEEAFNRSDAGGVAALFDKDAVYLSDDGEELRGRDQIEARLKDQFSDNVPEKLQLKVDSINIPSNNLAVEHGTAIVSRGDETSESRYRAEYTRKDNQWLLTKVEEQGVSEAERHLRELAWLAGKWEDRAENTSIQFDVNWDLGNAFLQRKFNAITEGRQEFHGVEYIGWDPKDNQIHSWYFDSNGGFGEADWSKQADRWVIRSHGVRPDGAEAEATMYYVPKGNDAYVFSSTERKVNGEAQPDLGPYTIYRKAAPKPAEASVTQPEQEKLKPVETKAAQPPSEAK